jgi:hypothetical protein
MHEGINMSASLLSDLHANQHATDLLTLEQLAEIYFRTTPGAIYARRKRDPASLPPAIEVPGLRRIFWHRKTVEDWFLSFQVPTDQLNLEVARTTRKKTKNRGRPTKAEQIERELQKQVAGEL